MNRSPEDTSYLDADDVILLHGLLFEITQSQAADRVRSRSVLEGAVGRPSQHAHYGGASLAMQAAVLAHGIAEGQSFVDGNKRTALVALFTFLEINGWTIGVEEAVLADRIPHLSGQLSDAEFGEWITAHLIRRSSP